MVMARKVASLAVREEEEFVMVEIDNIFVRED